MIVLEMQVSKANAHKLKKRIIIFKWYLVEIGLRDLIESLRPCKLLKEGYKFYACPNHVEIHHGTNEKPSEI